MDWSLIGWPTIVAGVIALIGVGGAWWCWFRRGPYARLCNELAQCGDVSFCAVHPESVEYRGKGFRVFVIMPWPNVDDEDITALANKIYARTCEFAHKRGMEFRATQPAFYPGGTMAIMLGLVKDGKPVDP